MEMILDRSVAPVAQELNYIEPSYPEKIVLSNGVELYNIVAGDQELIKIDMLFDAGMWRAKAPLIAGFTGAMLKEGSENLTQVEIAETIDFYGAYINVSPGYDTTIVSALTLKRHLGRLLPILVEVISKPLFPEDKLSLLTEKRRLRFIEESEKVSRLSQRRFWEELFGSGHPYAPHCDVDQFSTITKEHLESFYKSSYGSDGLRIVVSGRADAESLKMISDSLGEERWGGGVETSKSDTVNFSSNFGQFHIEKSGVVQNSITMGLVLPGIESKDHYALSILNTILGGYFGSRLNMNLREEKGYTYGIYSSYSIFARGAALVISSEVGSHLCKESIEEIFFEITRLKSQPILSEELRMVTNYMLGNVMRGFDGPFEMASSFQPLLESGLDYSYYSNMVDTIRTITPEEIMKVANRYLMEDKFVIVTAGV